MCGFVSLGKKRRGKTFELKGFDAGKSVDDQGFPPIHTIMRDVQIAPNRARRGQAEGVP